MFIILCYVVTARQSRAKLAEFEDFPNSDFRCALPRAAIPPPPVTSRAFPLPARAYSFIEKKEGEREDECQDKVE